MRSDSIRKLRLLLAGAILVLIGLLWAGIVHQLGEMRERALQAAVREGDNLTQTVAAHFSAFARTVDLWLEFMRIDWLDHPAHMRDLAERADSPLGNEGDYEFSIIGADGRLAYHSKTKTTDRAFLGEQEYFLDHARVPGADRLRIGDPAIDPVSGQARIHLSRPVLDRKGRFAGVIVLSLSPREVNRVYAGIDLGADGVVTLRRPGGTVLARSKDFDKLARRQQTGWNDFARDPRPAGHFTRRSTVDGIERLFSFRRMPEYGLVAVVGQSVAAATAPYAAQRRVYLAGGVLASLLLVALMLSLNARLRREARRDGELRASEARFRSLIQLSFDTYWEQDSAFRFTVVEGTGPDWRASVRRRMLGRRRWELDYVNVAQNEWASHIAALEARAPFRDLELCRVDDAGNEFWVSVSGEPVFSESGAFTGYRGVTREITQRKRAERLQTLEHRVNRSLADARDAARAIPAVLCDVCEVMRWECGEYWRADEAARVLRQGAYWIVPGAGDEVRLFLDRSRGLAIEAGTGLVGSVYATGEPLAIADLERDARGMRRDLARAAGIRSVFLFPVLAEGRVLGVMGFPGFSARDPDAQVLEAVRVVGSQVGQYLSARESERVLRANEARFRSLVDLSSDFYWEQDAEFRFTRFEGGDEAWRRTTLPNLIGRTRWEIGYDNMRAQDWAAHRAAIEAHEPFRDLELCRVDETGNELWIAVNGEPVYDESGAFAGYRGLTRNIGARKRIEQLQALEHEVNRALADADSTAAGLQSVMRLVGEHERWRVCGEYWHADEAAGVLRLRETWVRPDAPEAARAFIERSRGLAIRRGEGLSGLVWQSGEPLWIADAQTDPRVLRKDAVRATGLRGGFLFPVIADGRTIGVMSFPSFHAREPEEGLLGAVRVIGSQVGQFLHRKESERVLRESEARFRSLTQLSSDWYWEQDAEYRFTRIVGPSHLPAQLMLGKTRWELAGSRITEAGWHAHRAALVAHEPFRDFVNKFAGADGKPLYTSVNGEPMFAEDGTFAGYRGTARDVTQAMIREEELTRFRGALDVSADLILLVDPVTLRYLDVNDAACRALGYRRDELLRMGPEDVFSLSREELVRVYARLVAGDKSEEAIEGWYRCKDGARFPVESFRRAVPSGEGHVIVAVARDIRARKAAEQRLRDRELQQRVIASFGQRALADPDLDDLMRSAVKSVSETLDTEYCSLLEVSPDGGSLVLRAGVGYESEWYGRAVMDVSSSTSPGTAIRSGRPVVVEDFEGHPSLVRSELGRSHRIRSSLTVPIPRRASGAHGTLGVHARTPRRFSEEQVNFLQSIAHTLAAAIERKQTEDQLTRLAQFDTITGLPNRVLFRDRLEQVLVQAQRNRWQVGVMFVDLDRFKVVNDTLGHDYGDTLLARVAERLASVMRAGDTVGRLSGDEFAVTLANITRPDDAGLVAQKLLDALAVT